MPTCAAKTLRERATEMRRWPEDPNWQIQGYNVVATHRDNLHHTIGRHLHLDKAKWNVYHFRSRSVLANTTELVNCISQTACRAGANVSAAEKKLRARQAVDNLLSDATQPSLRTHSIQSLARLQNLRIRMTSRRESLIAFAISAEQLLAVSSDKRCIFFTG